MNQTVDNNATAIANRTQAIYSAMKPCVARVDLPDGRVRLIGVCAAARWLGVSQPALSALAMRKNAFPITWEDRARAEFPEFFNKA